jgi:hypothetical protein
MRGWDSPLTTTMSTTIMKRDSIFQSLFFAGSSVLALAGSMTLANAANAIGWTRFSFSGVNVNNWAQTNSNSESNPASGPTITNPTVTGLGSLTGFFDYNTVTFAVLNVNLSFATSSLSGTATGVSSENLTISDLAITGGGTTGTFSLTTAVSGVPNGSTTSSSFIGSPINQTLTSTTTSTLGFNNTRTFTFNLGSSLDLGTSAVVSGSSFTDAYTKTNNLSTTGTLGVTPFGPDINTITDTGTITGTGTSGTLTAFISPVPFDFDPSAGVLLLGAGFGLNKLRKNLKAKKNETKV